VSAWVAPAKHRPPKNTAEKNNLALSFILFHSSLECLFLSLELTGWSFPFDDGLMKSGTFVLPSTARNAHSAIRLVSPLLLWREGTRYLASGRLQAANSDDPMRARGGCL
jgi:hypothetical protein